MKILLTNLNLTHFTGTESTTYAIAKELIDRGHEVIVWTAIAGKMANKITELGACVVTGEPMNYDVAFVNHNIFWDRVKSPKFYTCHGTVDVEQPPTDTYFGVTEYLGGITLRQGIDLDRFKEKPINKELKNILLLSNPNYSEGKSMVKLAFPDKNVITIEQETFDIEEYIYQADLVISFFRGALESLACGRNVIYADWRHGDATMMGYDIITPDNYDLWKSGEMRKNIKRLTIDDLRAMAEKYNPDMSLRHLIERDFNIEDTADNYLYYANQEIYKDSVYQTS